MGLTRKKLIKVALEKRTICHSSERFNPAASDPNRAPTPKLNRTNEGINISMINDIKAISNQMCQSSNSITFVFFWLLLFKISTDGLTIKIFCSRFFWTDIKTRIKIFRPLYPLFIHSRNAAAFKRLTEMRLGNPLLTFSRMLNLPLSVGFISETTFRVTMNCRLARKNFSSGKN